jgi:hypothetical protein
MTPSGEDPMAEDPIPADAAHAMKTLTRYQKQDRLSQGRFGRDVRAGAATDDVQMADPRTTMQTDRADDHLDRVGYEIDAHAVAAAIVNRLLAGRTLSPPRAEDR